ncbi:phage tail assembly protein [Cellulosilyticum sp. ST5]|uniref:phage tail assembly protein n=1 Tax=Cellulosilyticum sp. ST5 TaxID=3055805 RepID=UPI0039776867
MIITLKKSIKYDGQEVKELELDLEALTAQDILDAEAELAAERKTPPIKEFDKSYLAIVGAKAAKVPTDMVKLLGAKDFTNLTMQVQNFLIAEA